MDRLLMNRFRIDFGSMNRLRALRQIEQSAFLIVLIAVVVDQVVRSSDRVAEVRVGVRRTVGSGFICSEKGRVRGLGEIEIRYYSSFVCPQFSILVQLQVHPSACPASPAA